MTEYLSDGEFHKSNDMNTEAKENGIKKVTLDRARLQLKKGGDIRRCRENFGPGGKWGWLATVRKSGLSA